jgi:carbamoyl-phosphate synthase large subunit
MEHIERAGIHSGDSISVYPPCTIPDNLFKQIEHYTKQLVSSLKVRGMINIQFVEHEGKLYVIEVNPRSSRTVPYISKVTGVPVIELATRVILGERVKDLGYGTGLYAAKDSTAVKVPVFSFEKLPMVETCLGPEMKSTGEVLGIGKTLPEALYKGLIAAGFSLDRMSNALITVADKNKLEVIPIAQELKNMGFKILATAGTAKILNHNGIGCECINKLSQPGYNIEDAILQGKINIIVNTPTKGRVPQRDGFKIRRMAVEHSIPCFTSLDTANAFCKCYRLYLEEKLPEATALNDI